MIFLELEVKLNTIAGKPDKRETRVAAIVRIASIASKQRAVAIATKVASSPVIDDAFIVSAIREKVGCLCLVTVPVSPDSGNNFDQSHCPSAVTGMANGAPLATGSTQYEYSPKRSCLARQYSCRTSWPR